MSVLEMKVPSPGESITEVEIATWLVKDGDYVEKDQPIAEVDSDKATLEFSESQILSFLQKHIRTETSKEIRSTTLSGDFKVFIKTYVVPRKNVKSVEDDFNVPLLSLNLVSNTNRRNSAGEPIYRINKTLQPNLSHLTNSMSQQ